jgi:hypothetical protein
VPKVTHYYIGLDPGKSGGVAVMDNHRWVETYPMPDPDDLWKWLRQFPSLSTYIALERVGGFIGTDGTEGGHRNKAAAHIMFTFGRGYGQIEMALVAGGYNPQMILNPLPQQWTKALGIVARVAKEESRTQWKARLRDEARLRFPALTSITLKTCDALLLAQYCRLTFEGSRAQNR